MGNRSMMTLRDYQMLITERVHAAWNEGCRNVMCQMPTGTGKTVVACQIISDCLREERSGESGEMMDGAMRVLVVAHRKEILEQMRETLRRNGLGEELKNGAIVVESVQKLRGTLGGTPELVIVDEAHHCAAKTYRMLWEAFPEARFLGLTATPCRLKREGLSELFDKLLCSYSVKQFVEKGWLAEYDYVVIRPDGEMRQRIDSLKKRGVDGDYQVKELGTVMDNRACIEQLWESYKQYAEGKQGIIFAINREHARHIAEYFVTSYKKETSYKKDKQKQKTGEEELKNLKTQELKNLNSQELKNSPIVVVDSATPKKERERIVREYKEGKIRILVNCDIYSEGYDAPFAEFIQLARPTLSLSKYLQQVGRGLRPNEDGRHTMILDNVGMYYLFGLPNADRDWQKMFREGQDVYHYDYLQNDTMPTSGFVYRATNERNSIDEGHNLDMMVVADGKKKGGKAEIIVTKRRDEYYCTLARNGKIVNTEWMFRKYHDFLDGFCWMQYGHNDSQRHYFDENGNYIIGLSGESELLPDGFIRLNGKGGERCYDAKLKASLDCMPLVLRVGEVEFVELKDGWHLRNGNYASVAFERGGIEEKDGYVYAFDSRRGEGYVISNDGKAVYRVLGKEDEATTVLWDERFKHTLHLLQCGMFATLQRKENPDLFDKWERKKEQLI